VSYENKRWEMLKAPTFLDPTEKPDKRPTFTIAKIILLNAFITITNSIGDQGSSYLNLQELLRKRSECCSLIQKSVLKKYNALSNYIISPQRRISSAFPNWHGHKPFQYPTYTTQLIPLV
jgi:hypothetical protein